MLWGGLLCLLTHLTHTLLYNICQIVVEVRQFVLNLLMIAALLDKLQELKVTICALSLARCRALR